MIREAQYSDIPVLVEMSISFLKEAGQLELFSPTEETLTDWVSILIQDPAKVCLVYVQDGKILGSIAGGTTPHFLNPGITVATEFAWWVLPEYRGKVGKPLLKAFEIWAKANNVDILSMGSLENINPKVMDRVYRKEGFILSEHNYYKRLK